MGGVRWCLKLPVPAVGVMGMGDALFEGLGAALDAPLRRLMRADAQEPKRRRPRTLRGQWAQALQLLHTTGSMGRPRRVKYGVEIPVKLDSGHAAGSLMARADDVAAIFRVMRIEAESHPRDASRATLRLVKRTHGRVGEWPLLSMLREPGRPVSLWDPVPMMVDRYGDTVSVSLVYRSLLLGGDPGAGKSNMLSLPLAVAANDPKTELWLFDYKRVELGLWKACATEFVGPNMEEAVDALGRLYERIDERHIAMEERGQRKVARGDYPLIFLVVDELMLFTTNPDAKAAKQFSEHLRNIVALSRATGVIPCVCTQKPEGRVVDTNLRDLFAFRWSGRCGSPEASNTILGAGMAARGFNAAKITPAEEGVGYLMAEDGLPVRGQGFHLTDQHIHKLAARAAALRATKEVS